MVYTETDSPKLIAQSIWYDMVVNQSCAILGVVIIDKRGHALGKLVCDELEKLDRIENYEKDGVRRKRTKPVNTIGGYLAQKIFKYKTQQIDNEIRYTIWRLQ